MKELHDNLKKQVGKLFTGPSRQNGDFGIEMEVEGKYLPTSCSGWDVHQDNSLRGKNGRVLIPHENAEDTPREYTTCGAVSYGQLWHCLTRLCSALKTGKTKVVPSHRCSTHIHVNMQNVTLRDCFGFLMFFVAVEPVLLRLCGNSRNGNLFCVPTSEAGDLPVVLEACLIRILEGSFQYWPSEDNGAQRGKYGAINIDQLPRFGSYEVRCFPASIDPDEIYTWAGWLNNIKVQAQAWGKADYSDFFDYASSNPQALLNTIFPNENLFLACGPQNVSDLVSAGVENSYEVYRALLPVFSFDKEEKKKRKDRKATPTNWDPMEQPFDDGPQVTIQYNDLEEAA